MPYNNDPGSSFVPPDFTVGLPPVQNWPHHAGEPPWILDPEDCPKPTHAVMAESSGPSSRDEGRLEKGKEEETLSFKEVREIGAQSDHPQALGRILETHLLL